MGEGICRSRFSLLSGVAKQARLNDNYAARFGRFLSEGDPIPCPICHLETVADAAFCNHCGERLPARCRGCGALNPPGSGFCYACGSPIAAPTVGAPRFSPPPPSAPVACPRCSKTSEPGSAYCYSCGLPLDEPPPRADAAPSSSYAPRCDASRERRGDVGYYERASVKEPGGFWVRLVAYWIDFLVSLAIALAVLIIAAAAGYDFGNDEGDALMWIVWGSSLILYRAIGWSLWSTTVGKRIFNLYVVRTDGSKIGFWLALARCLCYLISELLLMAGYLMIAFRKDKRGLHDLMCGTMVVRRR